MANRGVCSIESCGKPVLNKMRGWCSTHYQRWQKHGDPTTSKIDREHSGQLCSVHGCVKARLARGMCSEHYSRSKRTGDPLVPSLSPSHMKVRRWIEAHLTYQEDDCLSWPFSRNETGRGSATWAGRTSSAPNIICTVVHGAAPTPGHQAAHSCGKGHEGCVNPRHLRWATLSENERDKRAHGTLRRGTCINTNKLSEDDVKTIRRLRLGTSGVAVARMYGITPAAVSSIIRRKSWAWLD